jgi:endonuclease YncB( thermonuclease family)
VALAAATMLSIGYGIGAWSGPPLRLASAAGEPSDASVAGTSVWRAGHPAQIVRVLDGDTFEARVAVWPGLEISTRVRLRGIDAPELRARCSEEVAKAHAARAALAAILAEGGVGVSRVVLDKYGGRVIADASTRRTADVSGALLRTGLVRGYQGGHRVGWCAGEGSRNHG